MKVWSKVKEGYAWVADKVAAYPKVALAVILILAVAAVL